MILGLPVSVGRVKGTRGISVSVTLLDPTINGSTISMQGYTVWTDARLIPSLGCCSLSVVVGLCFSVGNDLCSIYLVSVALNCSLPLL